MARVSRLGVLGGTFDPIHIGHLLMGETAYDYLKLDLVLFVPAGVPPHKQAKAWHDPAFRLRLVQAAIAGNPHFQVSTVDLDRPAPHYSFETVALLRHQYGLAPDELFFIMGSDSLAQLPTWHEPHLLVQEARLAVAPRLEHPIDLDKLSAELPALKERVIVLPMPVIAISSTTLRQMLAEGRSVRYWIPEAALQIIEAERAYTAGRPHGLSP